MLRDRLRSAARDGSFSVSDRTGRPYRRSVVWIRSNRLQHVRFSGSPYWTWHMIQQRLEAQRALVNALLQHGWDDNQGGFYFERSISSPSPWKRTWWFG